MDVKIICREVCIYIEDTRMDKSGLAFQRERKREEKEVKTSKKQWLLKEKQFMTQRGMDRDARD